MQYTADLDQLAKTDPYTARIFAAMPGWAWTAYALAVGGGTLGAILLLLRKAAAAPLLALKTDVAEQREIRHADALRLIAELLVDAAALRLARLPDRKRGVEGKSVWGRGESGGRR